LEREPGAIGAHRQRSVSHGDRIVQPNLPKVLELVLAYDGSDREATELSWWEAVLGEERESRISSEVQVRGIRQVTVEIHGAPPGKKVFAISTVKVRHHSCIRV
jgi:hypothetical protein